MGHGDELKLEDSFCEWLASVGAKTVSRSWGKRGVPDVVADYKGKRVIFELKTDRPKGDGRKGSERAVDYPTVVGQIVMRMADPSVDYAIVIPEAGLPWFRKNYHPLAWGRTGIRFFLWRGTSAIELDDTYSEITD